MKGSRAVETSERCFRALHHAIRCSSCVQCGPKGSVDVAGSYPSSPCPRGPGSELFIESPEANVGGRSKRRQAASTGQVALVKAEGGDLTALCVVWVNDSVPSGALKLSPSAMEALGTPAAATISFPATPHADADSIQVTMSKEGVPLEYVKQCLMGVLAAKASAFDIPFNGRACRVRVEALRCASVVGRISQSTAVRLRGQSASDSARDSAPPRPRVRVGGLQSQIDQVVSTLSLALCRSEEAIDYGIKPPRGVLLVGPPGTGKTMLASSIANRLGVQLIIINGPEIVTGSAGATEAELERIFKEAELEPSIVFIDEIDTLCPSRDDATSGLQKRIVATLLTILDGYAQQKVAVIAATNRVDVLDPALRRPGRFDKEISIGVPNAAARKDILCAHLETYSHSISDACIGDVARKTHGFVGADLMSACKLAAWAAYGRKGDPCITDADSPDCRGQSEAVGVAGSHYRCP